MSEDSTESVDPWERNTETATLCVEIYYDPKATTPKRIASELDGLLDNALSTQGILDNVGDPTVSAFLLQSPEIEALKQYLQEPEVDDATFNLRIIHEMLGLPIPKYLRSHE